MAVLKILVDRHVSLREQEGIKISPEEAFGQLLAQYVGWERERILRACAAALEAANWTDESECVRGMMKQTLKAKT